MDEARFDAWTRRRLGKAAGALAGLLAASSPGSIVAGKRKRGKKRRRRCERLSTPCNPNNDREVCCNPNYCQIVRELGGHRCCRPRFLACTHDAECCGNLVCAGEGDARSCRTEP